MAAETSPIRVVVCYATAQQELLRELQVEQGATIETAIAASHILDEMASLAAAGGLGALPDPRDPGSAPFDPAIHQVGIFGKKKPLDTVLRDGDRVELYRPLLADPKETRRRRAGPRTLKRDS